ncbi:MAG TPA: hypothetical protein VEJ20_08425 [Candidatus Eremiobacteraceae bacterium]|nr:hypothetical protein [Candidatus Eremiobacteraceae bacterium]
MPFRILASDKVAVASLVFLVGMVVACARGAAILPDPNFVDPLWQGVPLPPCGFSATECHGHLLGTDMIGRDFLARLCAGGIYSIIYAGTGALMQALVGVLFAATILRLHEWRWTRWVSHLVLISCEAVACFPLLPLLLVITAVVAASTNMVSLGGTYLVATAGFCLGLSTARLLVRTRLGVEGPELMAAHSADASLGLVDGRMKFGQAAVVTTVRAIATILILESTISFYGFGVQPPTADWGNLLTYVISDWTAFQVPAIRLLPGICIAAVAFALYVLSDGIKSAFLLDNGVALGKNSNRKVENA